MPRIKIPNTPYRVSFLSFDLKERPHVHVVRDHAEAKIWFEPDLELPWNSGFPEHEISAIFKLLTENLELIKTTYANATLNR